MSTTPLRWTDDGSTMSWDHFQWDGVVVQNNKMKRVKNPIADAKNPAVITAADTFITGATGNADMTNMPVSLADLTADRNAANTAQTNFNTAKDALQTARTALNEKFAKLRKSYTRNVLYAASKLADDPEKLSPLGLTLIETSAAEVLSAPANLRSSIGKLPKTIRLNWRAVDGRQFYTAECAESADGPWTEIYKGCANRTVCKDLVSGKEYFFRAIAHNKLGPGAVSDITSTRAK